MIASATRMWAVRGRRACRRDASLLFSAHLVASRLRRGGAQGEPRDARARARDRSPFSLAYALHHTSWLYQYLRRPKEALAVCASRSVSPRTRGSRCSMRRGSSTRVAPRCCKDRPCRRSQASSEVSTPIGATGAALALPDHLGLLGSALIDFRPPGGRRCDAENKALSVAEESHDRCHEAELHRLKGELH